MEEPVLVLVFVDAILDGRDMTVKEVATYIRT